MSVLLRGQVESGRGGLVEAGRLLGSFSKGFNLKTYSIEEKRLKHTDNISSQSRRHWRYEVACCLEQKGSDPYEVDFSLSAQCRVKSPQEIFSRPYIYGVRNT